ncbi:hypothetical protein [Polyangium aurulentum]|uniref:hypothetical protein n=1 Tax=Polyangium aurulentum TaxID=2567896 RepID=UPI0010AE56B9|nr:hypothetical protein [Polyangium aurulentum]UQA57057.1 hypothetical protein E8A73_038070 [Polyangium aurulentum]
MILSEPAEPLPESKPILEILADRIQENGCWAGRADRLHLYAMASEIPGMLPSGTVLGRFGKSYVEHVRLALERLDHQDAQPIARVAGDILFLRLAATHHPRVALPEGAVDLREILPGRLERLLARVEDEPPADTMAAFEPALLRVCSEVVQHAAIPGTISIRDGAWLTYRLFQWLCLQLEALSPDDRISGMRRFVAHEPKFGAPVDRLDPAGFGRDRFDHRLAAILHALGAMEARLPNEVVRKVFGEEAASAPVDPWSVSSRALEDKLIVLAQRAHDGPALDSELDWDAPSNIPDLALLALLRLNGARFADLSEEARTRRFEALPDDLDVLLNEAPHVLAFANNVLIAAANAAQNLTDAERWLLLRKLREMKDGPTNQRARWLLFVALFDAGMDPLEEEAFRLTLDHAGDPMAPTVFGRFLLGITAREPARLEQVIEAVLAEPPAKGLDIVAFVAGALARVVVHGKPPAQTVVRTLLLGLAKRSPFLEDPRIREVLSHFGIKEESTD